MFLLPLIRNWKLRDLKFSPIARNCNKRTNLSVAVMILFPLFTWWGVLCCSILFNNFLKSSYFILNVSLKPCVSSVFSSWIRFVKYPSLSRLFHQLLVFACVSISSSSEDEESNNKIYCDAFRPLRSWEWNCLGLYQVCVYCISLKTKA